MTFGLHLRRTLPHANIPVFETFFKMPINIGLLDNN
jgi:hypothetical protein